jgi:hypothetical protein
MLVVKSEDIKIPTEIDYFSCIAEVTYNSDRQSGRRSVSLSKNLQVDAQVNCRRDHHPRQLASTDYPNLRHNPSLLVEVFNICGENLPLTPLVVLDDEGAVTAEPLRFARPLLTVNIRDFHTAAESIHDLAYLSQAGLPFPLTQPLQLKKKITGPQIR